MIIVRPCGKAQAIAHARINTCTVPNIIASGKREIAVTNQALAER